MTSKLRIVYDASARTSGPSLNDCLYMGPSFGQSIFDILIRFRLHRIALAGDIKKAFLMVSVKEDRYSLRFLWTRNVEGDEPHMIVLRFTRVVFGVNSSPNATINHHMKKYQQVDTSFVDKFLSSIYVDDVSLGSDEVESTYELYLKSKSRLAEAGFKLRKFVTNSEELRCLKRCRGVTRSWESSGISLKTVLCSRLEMSPTTWWILSQQRGVW